jgi:hypothetical protein
MSVNAITMLGITPIRVTTSQKDYTRMQKGRVLDSWQWCTPWGSRGPSPAHGKEANIVNGNSNDKAVHPAAVRSAKAWGLSLEEWLAYERDMENQDDYERWSAEMEAEASDAGKQNADLSAMNTPF